MAGNVFDIGKGISLDINKLRKELKDALSKMEAEVIKSVQKQIETINKAAQDQIKIIRQIEEAKLAEVKKGLQERIAAEKAKPGLDKSAMQAQIRSIRETEKAKVEIIKDGAKLQEAAINNMAKNQLDLIQGSNKKNLQSIKEFAGGAVTEFFGLEKVLGALKGGPASVGKLLVDVGKQVVSTLNQWADSARESMQIQDSLKAVIESTGAKAWTTTGQLNQLARDQSDATGKSRDEIAEMQSVLLGFRSVTKDVFADASQAVIDMSTVMGGDLKSAADQLGKALDSPIEGMDELKSSGVIFTEQQRAMVKRLVESGDLLGAQNIILGEVQKSFSGAAAAVNPAIQAQVAYNNAVTEFKIQVGTGWANATAGIRKAIGDMIQDMADGIRITRELREEQQKLKDGDGTAADYLSLQEKELEKLNLELKKLKKNFEFNGGEAAAAAGSLYAKSIKEQIILTEQLIRENKADLSLMEKKVELQELFDDATLRARKAAASAGTEVAREASLKAEEARVAAMERITNGQLDQARGYQQIALDAAKVAEAEAAREEKRRSDQASAEKFREENQKALDEELKKNIRNAEARGEISRAEADRLKGIIDARKEGEAIGRLETSNLSLQNQFLNANLQAYENLLATANDILDGTAPEEMERFARLKTQWAAYEEQAALEKFTDEQRQKRLNELSKQQQEVQSKVKKLYEEANEEAKKLYDTGEEQKFQDLLTEIRKKSLTKAVEFEHEYRKTQRAEEEQKLIEELEKELELHLEHNEELMQAEISKYREGSSIRLEIENQFLEERKRLEEEFAEARVQLEKNTTEREAQIREQAEKDAKDARQAARQETLAEVQKYLDAISSIANSIATIWTNNIDRETDEKLRANKEMIQSDEQRAANEKRILAEAAYEKYKVDLFAWTTNVIMATAQAAMAVLASLAKGDIPGAILAGIVGGFQVAAVVSARPKPPSFHTGGFVQGRAGQEVPSTLMAGETVTTAKQFDNIMKGFENLANMKTGGGTQLNVNVVNNASDTVTTSQRMDTDGLRIVIEKVVGDALSNGRMDTSLAMQQSQLQGVSIT
jgi:hypothetical protein